MKNYGGFFLILDRFKNSIPLRIPGCNLWLDASDISTFTFHTTFVDQVEEWRDKSGNNKHFNQATSAYQPTHINQINGLDVVTLNGSSQWLDGLPIVGQRNACTIFVAMRGDPVDLAFQSNAIYCESRPDSLGPIWDISKTVPSVNPPPTNKNRLFTRNDSGTIELSNLAGTQVAWDTTSKVITYTEAVNVINLWVNSVSSFTNQNYTKGSYTPTIATIGADRFGAPGLIINSYYKGDILEMIFYGRVLSSAEINFIEQYLYNKWGI